MVSQSATARQFSKLHDALADKAQERNEKYNSILLDEFFPLTELPYTTWIGTYSWTAVEPKTRWMPRGKVVYPFDLPQTPTEVSRDYLKVKYETNHRHTMGQFSAINDHRSPPLYIKPGRYSDMAYVDLKAAYWNIMRAVGWDVDYYPGRWLGKQSSVEDFPIPNHKVARNSMVSAGLITHQHIWQNGRLRRIKARNQLVNYDIWALAQDVLHSIANMALVAGAVYIHTDGYIIPSYMVDRFVEQVDKCGLVATVKNSGDADVKAIGAYRIGSKKTETDYAWQSAIFQKMYKPDMKWLLPKFAKLARS